MIGSARGFLLGGDTTSGGGAAAVVTLVTVGALEAVGAFVAAETLIPVAGRAAAVEAEAHARAVGPLAEDDRAFAGGIAKPKEGSPSLC